MAIDPVQSKRISMQLKGDDAGFSYYDFEGGELRQSSVAGMIASGAKTTLVQNGWHR
jgi:hypothetical protein